MTKSQHLKIPKMKTIQIAVPEDWYNKLKDKKGSKSWLQFLWEA